MELIALFAGVAGLVGVIVIAWLFVRELNRPQREADKRERANIRRQRRP